MFLNWVIIIFLLLRCMSCLHALDAYYQMCDLQMLMFCLLDENMATGAQESNPAFPPATVA